MINITEESLACRKTAANETLVPRADGSFVSAFPSPSPCAIEKTTLKVSHRKSALEFPLPRDKLHHSSHGVPSAKTNSTVLSMSQQALHTVTPAFCSDLSLASFIALPVEQAALRPHPLHCCPLAGASPGVSGGPAWSSHSLLFLSPFHRSSTLQTSFTPFGRVYFRL